jgi:hypothetical protein
METNCHSTSDVLEAMGSKIHNDELHYKENSMRKYEVSCFEIHGPLYRLVVDGKHIEGDLRDWPELWRNINEDTSNAKLLDDIVEFSCGIHVEVEDLAILGKRKK